MLRSHHCLPPFLRHLRYVFFLSTNETRRGEILPAVVHVVLSRHRCDVAGLTLWTCRSCCNSTSRESGVDCTSAGRPCMSVLAHTAARTSSRGTRRMRVVACLCKAHDSNHTVVAIRQEAMTRVWRCQQLKVESWH